MMSNLETRATQDIVTEEGVHLAYDMFISYASSDRSTADAVCSALEAAGLICWIAPRDVRVGRDYGEEIVRALRQCAVLVILLSAKSNRSTQVKNEVERAVSGGLRIITVRIEDVLPMGSLELHLSRSHWLAAFAKPIEIYTARLVEAVKDPGITGDPPPPPAIHRSSGSLKGVLVSAVTVVLLVILLHAVSGLLDPLPTPDLVQRPASNPWLFTDSDKRELTEDEVCVLCRIELFWARNELYARRRYKFSSENGKAYAASLGPEYEGTEPIDTKVYDGFNEAEKSNVFKIRRYEEIRNSFMPILNPENVGFFWHQLTRRLQ